MKHLLITITLLVPLCGFSQDSLFFEEMGDIPGKRLIYVDDSRMLVQVTEEAHDDDFVRWYEYLVLYEYEQAWNPEEIYRGFRANHDDWIDGVHRYPGEISSATIYQNNLIAVRTEYDLDDIVSYIFQSELGVVNPDNGEILWSEQFESPDSLIEEEFNAYWANLPASMVVWEDLLIVGMGTLGIYFYDLGNFPELEQINHIEVYCNNLTVVNDRLIFTHIARDEEFGWNLNCKLSVMDISDPEQFELINTIDLLDDSFSAGYKMSLNIAGDYLIMVPSNFARDREGDTYVYNIAHDDAPELATIMTFYEGAYRRVKISTHNDKLYVTNGYNLSIYGLDDPLSPQLFAQYPDTLNYWVDREIIAHGEYIFMKPGDGIRVLYFGPNSVPNDGAGDSPATFRLFPSFPNPFNSTTRISYSLPHATEIKLSVIDLSGRIVNSLYDGYKMAGVHHAILNADKLSSGMYFVRLKASDQVFTQKILLIK